MTARLQWDLETMWARGQKAIETKKKNSLGFEPGTFHSQGARRTAAPRVRENALNHTFPHQLKAPVVLKYSWTLPALNRVWEFSQLWTRFSPFFYRHAGVNPFVSVGDISAQNWRSYTIFPPMWRRNVQLSHDTNNSISPVCEKWTKKTYNWWLKRYS